MGRAVAKWVEGWRHRKPGSPVLLYWGVAERGLRGEAVAIGRGEGDQMGSIGVWRGCPIACGGVAGPIGSAFRVAGEGGPAGREIHVPGDLWGIGGAVGRPWGRGARGEASEWGVRRWFLLEYHCGGKRGLEMNKQAAPLPSPTPISPAPVLISPPSYHPHVPQHTHWAGT